MKKSEKKQHFKVFFFENTNPSLYNYLVRWKPEYKKYQIVATGDPMWYLQFAPNPNWYSLGAREKDLRVRYKFSFRKPLSKEKFLAHCLAYNLTPTVPVDEVYPEDE